MRIVSLVENTSHIPGIGAEHGLSLFIQTAGYNILFDMGQSDLFIRNAQTLGIDLQKVDFAVLSHGHYDHGGGLAHFLEINKTAPVYVTPGAFEPHFNAVGKYIGLDASLIGNERLISARHGLLIAPGISLYSGNAHKPLFPAVDGGFCAQHSDELLPDDFSHEQYLMVEHSGKQVLFSGCSHKGIENITAWFAPDILIGGFHFSKFPLDTRLLQTAQFLNTYSTEFYTCHCTGVDQFSFMKPAMQRLHYLSCGEEIIISE